MYTSTLRKTAAAATIAGLLIGAVPVVAAEGGPSVTVASTAPDPTGDNPIMFTVTVSESVADFDSGDISVEGGTVTAFSGSGASYSFGVVPGDGDPLHANDERLVTVRINENQFDGNTNMASNVVTRWYDSEASTTVPADITAPVITITSGPSEGSTSSTSSVAFEFTVDDASSTVRCSIVGQDSADSYFVCGSPQNYTLPDGAYRFALEATDAASNMASTSRSFSVLMSTSTGTTTPTGDTGTTTATSTPEVPNTGGQTQTTSPSGGGGQPVGSSPTAPGGGNSPAGGPPTGNAVIPTVPGTPGTPNTGGSSAAANTSPSTAGNAVIPTVPSGGASANTGESFTSPSSAPVVSQSSGGSALVAANTPGVPNTGSTDSPQTGAEEVAPATSPVVEEDAEAFGIPTSSLGAAVGTTDTGVPGWVWLVLAGLILIGVGVWALRQPAV